MGVGGQGGWWVLVLGERTMGRRLKWMGGRADGGSEGEQGRGNLSEDRDGGWESGSRMWRGVDGVLVWDGSGRGGGVSHSRCSVDSSCESKV